jgi:NDP-sugar pyrophosphorylase family protein
MKPVVDYQAYVKNFLINFQEAKDYTPWGAISNIQALLLSKIKSLSQDYKIQHDIAIHKKAKIEQHVTLKGPIIISDGCFVGSHAYMRGGVFIGEKSSIGPGCEVKSSFIMQGSALAHFNFVGDSLVGSYVNMEAGSIIANHFNERLDKTIHVMLNKKRYAINETKFGALVGDHTKIGANAVLSPGTILNPQSIVKRLELIEQCS